MNIELSPIQQKKLDRLKGGKARSNLQRGDSIAALHTRGTYDFHKKLSKRDHAPNHRELNPPELDMRLVRREDAIRKDLATMLASQLEDQKNRWGFI